MRFVSRLLFAVSFLAASPAWAQLNNEPFSFDTPDGGPGMSSAGREAIFRQELFGETPDNIMRGIDGSLIRIDQGEGSYDHIPIATAEDGTILEGYRGRGLGLGTFLPFLGNASAGYGGAFSISQETRLSISGWTLAVFAASEPGGGYVPPTSGSSIDIWTSQVYNLAGS